jgi:hypothetical protein
VRRAAYVALVQQPLESPRLDAIRRASAKNGILATGAFHEVLERELGRSVAIVPPGRPSSQPGKVI